MNTLIVPPAPESPSPQPPPTSGSGAPSSRKRHVLPKHFFKQYFLDVDGSPSMARFLSFVIVFVASGLAIAHVTMQHRLPDGSFFFGVGSMLTALYGMNQIRNTFAPPPPPCDT